ncbi:hypothetical protein TIFTF001_018815 [Ficus carica]|uniref:Uncharacterized protein n=1 Tax=Ficus carica TaxID=3494 RepID=A0AA88DJA5_FICCA|nr:hypothetical protein TIFTF001_018815 [Ficus carica]
MTKAAARLRSRNHNCDGGEAKITTKAAWGNEERNGRRSWVRRLPPSRYWVPAPLPPPFTPHPATGSPPPASVHPPFQFAIWVFGLLPPP